MLSVARRHTIGLLMLTLLAGGVTSCSSDDTDGGALRAGSLSVDILIDDVVTVAGTSGSTAHSGYTTDGEEIFLTMSSADGMYSHTWTDFSRFTQGQYYVEGAYTLTAGCGMEEMEGFDVPSFYGESKVYVRESQRETATVTLHLANAFVTVDRTEAVGREFESVKVMLHTPGGLYLDYPADETRYLCLQPGETELFLNVKLNDGREVTFSAYTIKETSAATLYPLVIGCVSTPQGLKVTVDGPDKTMTTLLDDAFIDAGAPDISVSWGDETMLSLPEGDYPQSMYKATVTSHGALKSLILSTMSISLAGKGMPSEVDLMNLSPELAAKLRALGLDYTVTSTGASVTLDGLMSNLYYIDKTSALSSFSLMAESSGGNVSMPVGIIVDTTPVEVSVEKTYPVTMGIDRARVGVRCGASGFMNNVGVEISDNPSADVWTKVQPLKIDPIDEEGLYTLTFDVPSGSAALSARILYCGNECSRFEISRVMPAFTIDVDAYATMAAVKIVPSDQSLLTAITESAHIYINGSEAPVYIDRPESGILTVIGLSPSTTYEFKATMMSGVAEPEFTPGVRIATESVPQLPNSDFEERADGVKYKNLPSGGRYSQTVVQIFNWQHHTTFDTEIPKGWANTNAKTFAMASDVHNTWYMQPSVYLTRDNVFSQSFATVISSVAFDPHGKQIPDYTQTGTPYIDYSPIIPEIAYRAAGKLFLGSYAFNPATMQEEYNEGIEWHSRPTSVNGNYRYLPTASDRSDCGLATVEVLGVNSKGEEIVIATGDALLALASSYTAFSVPLTYTQFGIKATRLKLMFTSSSRYGTIEEETQNVVTDSNVFTASSVGGQLWIDNVTLAY